MSLRAPYAFVAPAHPFAEPLREFAALVAAHPDAAALAAPGAAHVVHADIRAKRKRAGFRLDRFYWSIQRWSDDGFRALTLDYARGDGAPRWRVFPDDPHLAAMNAYFAAPPVALQVLRYVPLRRCTFRGACADGRPTIGKFKRARRFADAYALLGRVHAAVTAQRPGFAVAEPLGCDEAAALYFQSALPGADLSARIEAGNASALLARIGEVHAALHALDVAGAPRWEVAEFDEELARDLAWVAFMCPTLADEMAALGVRLAATRPALEMSAFCHGDFVCSQVLVADAGWSITDFDRCCVGDACRDCAMLVASLCYDVPLFAAGTAGAAALEQAVTAYLDGYAGRAGMRFAPARWAWHRACAELYFLALMLTKDRYRDERFEAGLARLRACAGALGAGRT